MLQNMPIVSFLMNSKLSVDLNVVYFDNFYNNKENNLAITK